MIKRHGMDNPFFICQLRSSYSDFAAALTYLFAAISSFGCWMVLWLVGAGTCCSFGTSHQLVGPSGFRGIVPWHWPLAACASSSSLFLLRRTPGSAEHSYLAGSRDSLPSFGLLEGSRCHDSSAISGEGARYLCLCRNCLVYHLS